MSLSLTPATVRNTIAQMPAFPDVVVAMLETINDRDGDIRTLVRQIQYDPLIAGHLLAAANNCAVYHTYPSVLELQTAAALLGMRRIREIVLRVALLDYMDSLHRIPYFQAHSRATAICAQELAAYGTVPQEVALSAALLHDLGQIWLYHFYPQQHARVASQVQAGGVAICATEREQFGMDHCEIGYWISHYWGLPEAICNAIRGHHHPEEVAEDKLVAVIHLAEVIINALDLPYRENNQVLAVSAQAIATLGDKWLSDAHDLFGRVEARYFNEPSMV